jgi:hypothetical protein
MGTARRPETETGRQAEMEMEMEMETETETETEMETVTVMVMTRKRCVLRRTESGTRRLATTTYAEYRTTARH